MSGSPKFTVNTTDIYKVLRGALVIACGAFLESLITSFGGLDVGPYQGVITTVSASAIELVRRYVADYSK